jgi:tryptophan-rich sensory protein
MTWTIAVAAAWGVLVGGLGAGLTTIGPWYYSLRKPSWQPPDFLFGPAWTAILAAASTAGVFGWNHAPDTAARVWLVVLFVLNGGLNIAWSLLFFRWRRPDWALVEVVPLWLSILALILFLRPFAPVASWLFVPYLLWVSFASVLNRTIVTLNRPFAAPAAQRA